MSQETKTYNRFEIAQRIEHFVLILSFTLLALTGLPQKYPLSPISQFTVSILGGIEFIRIIHRIAATVFVLEAVYHLVYVGYQLWVRQRAASMVPTVKDGKDAVQAVRYNLGMTKEAPKMPRFNFAEKMEYWAMIWGLLVMAVTGFMLWNPIATSRILPGVFIPAAKVAHGGEAVLAVLAIILWHFYHVHLRFFNKAMFNGKLTRHQMEDEHGQELEDIEQGRIKPVPPAEVQRRRLSIFIPIAAVVSVVLVAVLIYFVTFEETAIVTIIPEEVEAGDSFDPRTPTPAPTEEVPTAGPTMEPTLAAAAGGQPEALTWDSQVGALFEQRCVSCHGSLGGFSAETYDDVMKGITAGDPENSLVINVQEGDHPGLFEADELELIRAWIAAGAPQE